MQYKANDAAVGNEINTALLYTESLSFIGSREQAGDINLSKTIDKQLNGNSSESLHFDIPQGTYTHLEARILLSRNSGVAHTMKIIGRHHYAGGGFDNFIIEIDNDLLISGVSKNADGTNNVVLSKKVDRNVAIDLNLNSLLDGISEAEWMAADGMGGMIVVDGSTNPSLYFYIVNNISNHLEIRFL